MKTKYIIFQESKGFIANSSGAAFFQFYLIETPKNMVISDILLEFGVKPDSTAHELLKKTGILDWFISSHKTPEALKELLEGKYPDSYAHDRLDFLLKSRYKRLPEIKFDTNDYYCGFVGADLEGWSPEDDEKSRSYLGFLQQLRLSEDKKAKFLAEDVYFRIY